MSLSFVREIREALRKSATSSPEQAKRFFKTGPGSYAEKDEFIGVPVPVLRKIAKTFDEASLDDLQTLLSSKFNEERLLALLILGARYQKAGAVQKEEIYQFYLRNLKHVNNWNLVDSSAHLILGAHIWDKDRSILLQLAKSDNLWERRVAIVSTWYFTKNGVLSPAFEIAELLFSDEHDLIHKAVGWMLREAGKRNEALLIEFLKKNAAQMPKTMRRYAIERLRADQKSDI